MKIFFLILITFSNISAINFKSIDTVFSFYPGTGQNVGQDSAYFPNNIFGLPSDIANADVQEVRPTHILSLGLDGEITVGLKNANITNVEGPDFIIYENVFKNPFNGLMFAEPAVVSVSSDGINFYKFPYDSVSLSGLAGTKPTLTKNKKFDPYNCGGNEFDLNDIGLNEIKYIKLKDITSLIKNNTDHDYYDPTLTGFDLDAIIILGINSQTHIINNEEFFINSESIFALEFKKLYSFKVINLLGETIYSKENSENIYILKTRLKQGIYFVTASNSDNKKTYKFIVN